MLNSNSIQNSTRAVFLLKLSHNQITDKIRLKAFRYCFKNNLQIAGFFKAKEGIGMPEDHYIYYTLLHLSTKCQMDMDVILFTNFKFLPLDKFPIIQQSLTNGSLTVKRWNF